MGKTPHILICDDDPVIHESLGLYLKAERFDFSSAYDGEQALSMNESVQPDLIILDLMMPKISGTDVCREIRRFSSVPIIMLTAKGEEIDRVLGLELGADDYIVKPFSPREVIARIKAVLRRLGEKTQQGRSILRFDGLEINISCPNVKKGGVAFGTVPEMAAAVTRAVRESTHLPVIVKLSPNVTDIVTMAKVVEDNGAHAISLINTLIGMAIDVRTRRPKLGNIIGGLSGPAIKPVALRMVWQVASAVRVPVIGIGGIGTAEDAVEFLLAGATAVQVGTANFYNPSAVCEILTGIQKYLLEQGEQSVQSIIGTLRLEG